MEPHYNADVVGPRFQFAPYSETALFCKKNGLKNEEKLSYHAYSVVFIDFGDQE